LEKAPLLKALAEFSQWEEQYQSLLSTNKRHLDYQDQEEEWGQLA
jgi:sulfur transfer protein SufE